MSSTFLVITVASTTRLESIAGQVPMMEPPLPEGAAAAIEPSIASVSSSNHASSSDTSSFAFEAKIALSSSLVAAMITSCSNFQHNMDGVREKSTRHIAFEPGLQDWRG